MTDTSTENGRPRPARTGGTLGTFSGVFTPSILTILGIILFLRMGYVVGKAGLERALIIICLANAISVLTSVSLSAIATNLRVKGGGDYYLISRTLGLEFGGAIGIVLFLAQSVSIAFYCIGFGEAVGSMLPSELSFPSQFIAVLAIGFLFIFAWLGADWATKFQYGVMALLALALGSFYWGGLARWEGAVFVANLKTPLQTLPFWTLFAIFFPAVTGFTQGVSMSGDLQDPGRSLPLGTFMAVGISILVYFSVAILFAGALPVDALATDYEAMKRVASVHFLIDAGVISATLSSAMASFLGAPRILQSLAGDRIFPFLLYFAHGVGPMKNPRRGVLLSSVIALATVALGNLNVIAPIVSMFFLISYGLLNYATFFESRSASPSFRPRFKWFDSRLSLLGFLACLGVMLAINITAGMVAISLLFAVYQYLKRTAGPARWADSRRSYHLQRVRENLLAAAAETEHPRDWRPHVAAFSNDSHRRKQLLTFASWIEGRSGLITAVRVLEGTGLKMLKARKEAEAELKKDIVENGLNAFPLVVVAPDLGVAVHTLIQSLGIGPIRVNTLLLNWLEKLPQKVLGLSQLRYSRYIRTAFRLGCNIVVLDTKTEAWDRLAGIPGHERRVDVWWGDSATSRLMILLAYLVKRNPDWEAATIRVLTLAGSSAKDGPDHDDIKGMLDDVRIDATLEVVENGETDTVTANSSDASIVFIPFRLRQDQIVDFRGEPIQDILDTLPITALVLAAEDIELDAEPEEGKAAEMAVAYDALSEARERSEEAAKEAEAAQAESEEALNRLQQAQSEEKERDDIQELEAASKEAQTQANKALRKAGKAKARLEAAEKAAEAAGVFEQKVKEDA